MTTMTITANPRTGYTYPTHPTQRPLEIADVRGLVDALVDGVLDSRLFTDHVQGIRAWHTAMNANDLTTPEGRRKASSALSFLIHRVIRPTLVANRANPVLAMQMGLFEKKCVQILEITCPDATLRQKLMESYLIFARKGATHKEKKEKVIQAYAQLEERLSQMTQLNQEALRQVFEDLKAQLLVLNENQALTAETTQQQLTDLTRRMANLSEQFSTHAESAVHAGASLMAYKEGLSRNLKEMHDIARRVYS